jgi:hypothetical protein
MFANQNSACKLRNRFTLDELARQFDLEERTQWMEACSLSEGTAPERLAAPGRP